MVDQLPDELRTLKNQMKSFINDVVIPREPELMREDSVSEATAAELKTSAENAG